jgi:hypothetical protein
MGLTEGQRRYKEFLMNPPKDYYMGDKRKKQLKGVGIDADSLETITRINTINRYVGHKHSKEIKYLFPLRKAS